MFCQAITSRGTPCIASCKADSVYCHTHDKNLTECPVCLEEVPHVRTLRCGHHLCVECLQMLTADECPMCRRACDRSDMHKGLIELRDLLQDLHDMNMSVFDDANVNWWVDRYNSTDYIDTVTRVVDLSCSFHSVVFRQPHFLGHITLESGGIPGGKDDILVCVRRFHSCVDSFKQRTGFRPRTIGVQYLPQLLYPLVPLGTRWIAFLEDFWADYREWEETG